MQRLLVATVILCASSIAAAGQNTTDQSEDHQHQHGTTGSQAQSMHQSHGQMEMPGMEQEGMHAPQNFIQFISAHNTSGTSAGPVSTPAAMFMSMRGNWRFMFHGDVFLNELQQTGPLGGDKFFSTNWFMPMAQWRSGPNTLTLRAMLSLEPATVTKRRYPELFQQGETAFGRAIANGQHPHDLFMEVAALYDLKLGENSLLSFYAAPVGDPAMGPTAYPHRASASEDPLATLGHHLQDSTHIVDDVITMGLTYRRVRVEASGFHGREPDELRWNIDTGKVDSWSTRLTVNPARNWSAQYSIAHLAGPEALHPEQDVQRMTASLMYNRPLEHGNWATSLIWGRNRNLAHREILNGYLAESTLRFRDRNYLWGRIENVDRTTDLVPGTQVQPPGAEERFLARVQAYTAGYDREFMIVPHLSTAIGGQVTLYSAPPALTPIYGSHPLGAVVFLRLRPAPK